MRALILSKALVVGAYRRKLVELARLGVDVVAVVPPEWHEAGGVQSLEPFDDGEYRLIVAPVRFNGHFHLHYYPTLPHIVRQERPDIVHVDEEPYNLATFRAVRAAHRERVPSLFFSWQNLVRSYPPPFSWMERSVYKSVSAAIAGSHEVGEVLRAKGYTGAIFEIPQFGVDPTLFQPGDAGDRPFTVGFPNRLVPAKAPLLALAAFAHLPGDARLDVVGDGPMQPQLQEDVVRRHLEDRVSIRPRIPSAAMPAFLRALDVVLLPSRTTERWKEQFGRILIEAMACGVPVVASDSGEIPRVVGDAGIIVPEGDEVALAAALRRLYDDHALRLQLGMRGRQRVLAAFTHARVAESTLQVYREVVANRGNRG